MSRVLLRTVLACAVLGSAVAAGGQPRHAAVSGTGHVLGAVRDELGAGISGVSVVAVGATIAQVVTDAAGRFAVALPPGLYLLRADRAGYAASAKTTLRVVADRRIERNLTLRRQAALQADAIAADDDPSVIAWRLRHLTRTVLREVSHGSGDLDRAPRTADPPSVVALVSGRVNLFTTTPVRTGPDAGEAVLVRVADLVIGAPAAGGGWQVRGAMSSGSTSGWGVLGHYWTRAPERHRLELVAAATSQSAAVDTLTVNPAVHSAATVRLSGEWQATSAIELRHAIRVDRDDSIPSAALFSPDVTMRVRVMESTRVTASVSRAMTGPQTNELLAGDGRRVWVLPGHMLISSGRIRGDLRPEIVRTSRIGLEQEIVGGAMTVAAEWFTQDVTNQMALMFGRRASAGAFEALETGNVAADGWRLRLKGIMAPALVAEVELTTADAVWDERVAPASLQAPRRYGHDRVIDVHTSLLWIGAEGGTRVAMSHRRQRIRQLDPGQAPTPLRRDTVTLDFQQRAPIQPLAAGVVSLFLDLRTGFHGDDAVSLYDEPLTAGHPVRVSGGVQVKF